MQTQRNGHGRWRLIAILTALALVLVTVATPAVAGNGAVEREDVLGQGGVGVHADDGARLQRAASELRVRWKAPTPEPGSYAYPLPTMVPPGAPEHPPINPGAPEVFTLWAFIFNHPALCNGPCDFDDIGATPAQGGIYQLDGIIATKQWVKMSGAISVGQPPLVGVALSDPANAEVHIAMAPHGMALTGADLERQLTSSVGTPAFWFPALFID